MERRTLVFAITVVVVVAGFGTYYLLVGSASHTTISQSTSSLPGPPYHPNVKLVCGAGTYLADHRCVSTCPPGYAGVTFDAASSSVCMSADEQPTSVYDLAGLQVSADGGKTVYLVVQMIPLTKVEITGQSNYNTNVWLPVALSVLDGLPTVAAVPKVTTETASIGDTVGGGTSASTFKILEINPTAVTGNYSLPYPICCSYQTKVIRLGDDVGTQCEGISEVLADIDYQDQLAVFAVTVSHPPPGGCPICLSGSTLIDSPNGEINVKNLTVGMLVWTSDSSGRRIAVPILEIRSSPVLPGSEIIHIAMEDGRQLYVSPGHPTADGRLFGQLRAGDHLDGSTVVAAELVPYDQPFTYDLLPSGPTGFYWANGILVGSTLENPAH